MSHKEAAQQRDGPAFRCWLAVLYACCRRHFIKVVQDPAAKAVRSRQDVVLWLWAVHNEVGLGVQPGSSTTQALVTHHAASQGWEPVDGGMHSGSPACHQCCSMGSSRYWWCC
jgi:hypothetical protein